MSYAKKKRGFGAQEASLTDEDDQSSDSDVDPFHKTEFSVIASAPPKKKFKSSEETFFSSRKSSSRESESEDDAFKGTPFATNRKAKPSENNNAASSSSKSGGEGVYSAFALNLMARMGHKEGKGLGKHNQGRTEIIETSKQRGRKGLGTKYIAKLEPSDEKWDYDKDEIAYNESVDWLPECTRSIPRFNEMQCWIEEGRRKETIDDEVEFCDKDVLKEVLSNKEVLDHMEGDELRKARTRSNPFETIRGAFFLNRAAMKMANMDAACDFMFTNPKNENGEECVGPDELLYFADVCAGPGGFSEYVLWKKNWKAKGFGFTLKGANDFKLEDFFAGPSETFEPHYGVNGSEGDGDVFKTENQNEFRDFVLKSTQGFGVHFMMADGGFSVDGQENIQEVLSKQLYLCQFLVALGIVRPGGHFVCKLFDLFTPFSVGLIYLLYMSFKKVAIYKPVTSRPANSERYVICQWLRQEADEVREYMNEINKRLTKLLLRKERDINHVVPLDLMKSDRVFCEYIKKSNNELGRIQTLNLSKIHTFFKNPSLYDGRQSEVRKKCLEMWQIPDKARITLKRPSPNELFQRIIKNDSSFTSNGASQLDEQWLKEVKNVSEYCCVVTGGRSASKEDYFFFISLGRLNVYHWDGCGKTEWRKLNLSLELPQGTLFYAEIVNELQGEGMGQKKNKSLHILDAFCLGEENISELSYKERMRKARLFAHAVSKPSRSDYIALRVKNYYDLNDMENIFNKFEGHVVKGKGSMERLCYPCDENRFYLPLGIIIFKVIQEPWLLAFSKSKNKAYYFNRRTNVSSFEEPKGAFSNFKSTFKGRTVWSWEEGAEGCMGKVKSKCFPKNSAIEIIRSKSRIK